MEGVVRSLANYVPLSPISFLERAAKVYRDRTSVVYGSIKYTWEETHRRCVKLASSLNRLGVARGDVFEDDFEGLAEVLRLERSDGLDIQRCYLDYLEPLVSNYKAARSSNPTGG
nr:AMP-binding, conserved site-containing protein [Tanacetum cinerariifolium]